MAQLHPKINYYRAGLSSDVNQNGFNNNFDPFNQVGVRYPALLFPYEVIEGTRNLSNAKQTDKMDITLLFYDTMFYEDDGENDTRSEIEIARDLDEIATGFVAALRQANIQQINKVTGDNCQWLGIDGGVRYQYLPFQHNSRLMCVRMDFTILYSYDCPIFNPDFDSLVDTPVPVENWDYSDKGHKNDSL